MNQLKRPRAQFAHLASLLLALFGATAKADTDGGLDTSFGDAGRSVYGFLESSSPQLRAVIRYAQTGTIWQFADDSEDPAAVYMTRSLPSGQPDPIFGPANDGRRRITLPNLLPNQTEAITLNGAVMQANGVPVLFGGLRSANAEGGVFPALLCRLNAAGLLDASFDGDGCKTIRSFLSANETCSIIDAAVSSTDQSILVIGNCAGPDLVETPFVARILPSGATDTEFGAGAGIVTPARPAAVLSQHYESLVLQPSGLFNVLGSFEVNINAVSNLDPGVLQFDGGGSVDSSFGASGFRSIRFDLGLDNHDRARDLKRRPDGQLVILAEARTAAPSRTLALLAQLNAQGQLDPAFGSGGKKIEDFGGALDLSSRVGAMELDSNGRLLISAQKTTGQIAGNVDVGTEFWLTLPRGIPPETVTKLMITAEVATSGVVSSPSLAQSFPFTALPGVPALLELPHTLQQPDVILNDAVSNGTIHVVANGPVSVVPLHGRSFSVDSALIRPVTALGKNYRVMSWGQGLGAGSELAVVATRTPTRVSFNLTAAVESRQAGVPFTVVLNEGQTYHLRVGSSGPDLTGSIVSADQPVAVFSGNTAATVPNFNVDFGDLAYEQQTPLDQWGTVFAMVPDPLRPNGDVIRILAHESDTVVYENGLRLATLLAGQSHIVLRSFPTVFTTSKPASVAQFGRGCKADDNPECIGDPFQLNLEPMTRWSSRTLLGMHSNGGAGPPVSNRMTIVAPHSAAASVRVNAAPLAAGAFQPIGSSGLVFAQLLRTPDSSDLVTADAPISVTAVGLDGSEGHAHVAAALRTGTAATPVATADDLLLRLRENGNRDNTFGSNGVLTIDHSSYFQTSQQTIDRPLQILQDATGLLVGSAVRNQASAQNLLFTYKLASSRLFADGFE